MFKVIVPYVFNEILGKDENAKPLFSKPVMGNYEVLREKLTRRIQER